MKFLRYFKYMIRHKWFVLIECWRRGLYWQGLVHDWTKFLPSEFFPYVEFFFGKDSNQKSREARYQSVNEAPRYFQFAWSRHLARNRHHWQYWLGVQNSELVVAIRIPKRYIQEMICDWIGAGRAQGYYDRSSPMKELRKWYEFHSKELILHPDTRGLLECYINKKR